MCKLTILILTKNEEKSVAQLLTKLKQVLSSYHCIQYQIALIDDSTDSTRSVAISLGALIIDGGGQGLGYAYLQGLEWLKSQPPCDYVLTFDGDGQVDLNEFHRFWQIMSVTKVDMLVSSRFKNGDDTLYSYPIMNRFGVYLLSFYLSVVSGQKFTDSHGGLRLFNWSAACAMQVRAKHSYVQVSSLSVIRKKLSVLEVASVWKKRSYGESRVVSSKLKYMRKMLMPLLIEACCSFSQRLKYAFK